MNASYANTLDFQFFSPAQDHFNSMIRHLESACLQEHGTTEEYIRTNGDELLRLMFQGYLDKQAEDEERAVSVTPADGIPRNHIRQNTSRVLTTVFGKVTVKRFAYSQRNVSNEFPLDAGLNLNNDQYSDGVRKRVITDAIDRSYDNVVKRHRENCPGIVGKYQTIKLVEGTAQDFVEFYEQRTIEDEQTDDLLVLSFDGKGLVMLPDGLREATRKNAEKSKKKCQTRLSPGEKKDRKRMAMVATVYTVRANPRSPESIMNSEKKADNVVKFRPPIRNKRVWASVERDGETVIEEAFDEALKRDPERKRQWVVVVDGHPHQLKMIERVARRKQVKTSIIMDFIHVLEYLWKAAHCLHDKGDKSIEKWVEQQALKILHGQSGRVARGIKQSATKRKLKNREAIDKCASYLQKNRDRLCYDKALRSGFPIASGVIEGACRHLINDRLDITGARWSLQGAEAILKLRSINSSGDWDEYWSYHHSCSKKRNYGELMVNREASS
ncbi:ISKra4 family transposase [Endozoicomonas gorgoniicola]|uniref:ISKra4 family transposase n=1 Tax=Endozoicomonas gorgoniicola TaxID=1234144 RepID=A0ABT3MQ61_9GAMM|nr:ISKra4 family transposase [Endozoicomonas gorgoniicola]MCW7551174.1 ISKra4 family transposase [Endozoicomonas gorgoniicola]